VARLALAGVAVASLVACSKKVGDECVNSADCGATGEITCDPSQPGGYCVVEGCNESSCPSDSACVRFFPGAFLNRPCDPAAEDRGRDDCDESSLCLPSGLCAPRSLEKRYCVATCGGNDDCRSGYECRLAGTRGTVPLSKNPAAQVNFCAPR
jgi:hypothetical protein